MVVVGQRCYIRGELLGLSRPDQKGIGGESMATSSVTRVTSLSKERIGSISGSVCQSRRYDVPQEPQMYVGIVLQSSSHQNVFD